MLKLKHHFPSADPSAFFEKLIVRSPGACRWFGLGTGFLSLPPDVTVNTFRALAANHLPGDDEPLVKTRFEREGRSTPFLTEIVITLTPSVALLLGRSLDIGSAHWHASEAVMRYLEIFAAGPTEREGIPCEVISSNVVGISFESFASIAGTPVPEIRYLLFSLTYDEEEEKWLPLDTTEIADECEYAVQIYLSELCPDWEERGIEVVEDTADPFGRDSIGSLN